MLVLASALGIRIPPKPTLENSKVARGIISEVSEGGVRDLCFRLKGDGRIFYVNRGLQNGFGLSKAKRDFTGREAIIYYLHLPTLLRPGDSGGHMSRIVIDGKVIYTEF